MHGVDGVGLQRDGSFVEEMFGCDRRAHPHLRRACQKRPDAAGRVRLHLGHRPLGDDAAAVGARAGSDLDEVVRVAQHGHVVIHHHHGVAVGQKVVHDAQQPLDVRRMQPDGGLVQYVEDAGGAAAHGAREGHALTLAVRKRLAGTVEGEVSQPQLLQPLDWLGHLARDGVAHRAHLWRKPRGHARQPLAQLVQRQGRHLSEVAPVDGGRSRLLGEPRAVAVGAHRLAEELRHARHALLVLRFRQRVSHGVHGAVVGEVQLGGMVFVLGDVQDVALLHGTVQHDVLLGIGQIFVGHIDAHAHFAGHLRHERPHEVAPRCYRALFQGKVGVGDERGLVDVAHDTGAAAGGARAAAVEGEVLGGGAVEFHAAGGAGNGQLGGHVQGRRVHVPVGTHMAAEAREHEAQVVQKLRGRAERGVHAGDAGPLAQGEGRRYVQHLVHGGASGLGDAPARVGGKRLQVAAAPLGIQHAQRERAFARPGYARDAHELPQRYIQREVLQVVHPRPAHLNGGRLGEGKRRGGFDVFHGGSILARYAKRPAAGRGAFKVWSQRADSNR